MKGKKGLSPLVATLLLVVFALVLGAAIMTLGKSYISKINDNNESTNSIDDSKLNAAVVINIKTLNDPLKLLQIRYITDEISKEEYLQEEQKLIG